MRIILFDAVGTLIYPAEPVARTYGRIARTFGSEYSDELVASRFRDAFSRQEGIDQCELGWKTSEQRERQRWRDIIEDVFDDVPQRQEVILNDLWEYYAAAEAWRLFDDVPICWQRLTTLGFEIGIASNFDARLETVCGGWELLHRCQRVFISSQLGFRKPATSFFRAVEAQLECHTDITLVGDDPRNDLEGANSAGWHSVLVSRNGPTRKSAAISSLIDLPQLQNP